MTPLRVLRKWPKGKYGRQIHGLVIQTFFLWEINRKFFFLAWGFHILATRKNIFCHPGGSQWARGGLLACFRAKKCYFGTNVDKNQSLLTFKDIFLTIMTSKHCRTLKVTLFTNKNGQKGCPKASKWQFFDQKSKYLDKKYL